jgi:acetyl esterase/lipase
MTDHIIVLPGGGYGIHAPHEGEPIAQWLRRLGIEASVFKYPVKSRHPAVLDAVRAEIRRVRAAGATRVGLIGFSAGGHAAGFAAVAPGAAADERVDLVILGYPVVSMMLETHKGSRDNLLGPKSDAAVRAATSIDMLVTPSAPPMFVWHTAQDSKVPVQHSYLLGMALAAAGVPHELHVYERGVHGIGLGLGVPDRAEGLSTALMWPDACAAWLRAQRW